MQEEVYPASVAQSGTLNRVVISSLRLQQEISATQRSYDSVGHSLALGAILRF
jgi:hypothetical protein